MKNLRHTISNEQHAILEAAVGSFYDHYLADWSDGDDLRQPFIDRFIETTGVVFSAEGWNDDEAEDFVHQMYYGEGWCDWAVLAYIRTSTPSLKAA